MQESNKMVRVGGTCGIIAFLLYLSAALLDNLLPGHAARTTEEFLAASGTAQHLTMGLHFLGSAFGLFGIIAFLGLHRLLTTERPSVAVTVATVFGCVGMALVAAMLIVQGTVMAQMGARFLTADESERQTVVALYRALRSIDLGLDLVWDVFICVSILLLGFTMIRSRYFGRIFGIAGIIIAAALLALNVAAAPTPPASVGLVDLGPLAGLWFLAVSIQMLRSAKHVME